MSGVIWESGEKRKLSGSWTHLEDWSWTEPKCLETKKNTCCCGFQIKEGSEGHGLGTEIEPKPGKETGWNLDLKSEGKKRRMDEISVVRCRMLTIFSGQHLT